MHTELATVPDFTLQRLSRQPGDCERYMPDKTIDATTTRYSTFRVACWLYESEARTTLAGTDSNNGRIWFLGMVCGKSGHDRIKHAV